MNKNYLTYSLIFLACATFTPSLAKADSESGISFDQDKLGAQLDSAEVDEGAANGHPRIMPSDEKIQCASGTHQIFQPLSGKADLIGAANRLEMLYATEAELERTPWRKRGAYSIYRYRSDNLEADILDAKSVFRRLAGEKFGTLKYDFGHIRKDVGALRKRLIDSGELKKGADYKLACEKDVALD